MMRTSRALLGSLGLFLLGSVGGCASSEPSNETVSSGTPEVTEETSVDASEDEEQESDSGLSQNVTDASESRSLEPVESSDTEGEVDSDTPSDSEVAEDGSVTEGNPSGTATKGPYYAGYRVVEWTYDLPGLEEPRTIEIGLWYPTEVAEGEVIKWGDSGKGGPVRRRSCHRAPRWRRPFRPRVHHGDKGLMGDSSNTSEFFASHGWVTIAPNHGQYLARLHHAQTCMDVLCATVGCDPGIEFHGNHRGRPVEWKTQAG